MTKKKDILVGFVMMILNIYIWLMKIVLVNDKTNSIKFVEFIILIGFLGSMFYGYLLYFNKSRMKNFNVAINVPLLVIFLFDLVRNIQNGNGLGNIFITLMIFIYITMVEMGCLDIYTGYEKR